MFSNVHVLDLAEEDTAKYNTFAVMLYKSTMSEILGEKMFDWSL